MNLLGFPVEITQDAPPDQIFLAPSNLIDALRASEAAQTIARHGIIPKRLAFEFRRSVNEQLDQAVREHRVGVIKF